MDCRITRDAFFLRVEYPAAIIALLDPSHHCESREKNRGDHHNAAAGRAERGSTTRITSPSFHLGVRTPDNFPAMFHFRGICVFVFSTPRYLSSSASKNGRVTHARTNERRRAPSLTPTLMSPLLPFLNIADIDVLVHRSQPTHFCDAYYDQIQKYCE